MKGVKKDVIDLQQSTTVLSSVGNKMSVQESAKVKVNAKNKFEKEGMGSTSVFSGFQKVHGNGENTWSKVDASTRQEKLKIAMSTVFEVKQFSSFH